MSRRTFLQVSAAGVVSATALGGVGRASAEPYSKFTWISPRGTLEVLDDYPYWVGQEVRLFRRHRDRHAARPVGRHRDGQVRRRRTRPTWASPRRACSRSRSQNGMKLKSRPSTWARSTPSDFAFRKGEGANDLKRLEGKTILLGSRRLAVDRRSDAGRAGRRHHQGQVCRGRLADLGHRAAAGPGRRGARLGRPARRVDRPGPRLRLLARRAEVAAAGQHLRDARGRPRRSRQEGLPRQVSARLGDGPRVRLPEPARRGRSRVRAVPDACHQHRARARHHVDPAADRNVFRGDMDKRKGWGWHDMAAWQTFFDKIYELGQITKPIKAEDVCTNDCIAAANDFDHAKVKADADGYKLQRRLRQRSTSRTSRRTCSTRPCRADRQSNRRGRHRAARIAIMNRVGRAGWPIR